MNLYKISQSINTDYDTYDSAVIAATDEAHARTFHPDGCKTFEGENGWYNHHTERNKKTSSTWVGAGDLQSIEVEWIGVSLLGDDVVGVVCSSFNAG